MHHPPPQAALAGLPSGQQLEAGEVIVGQVFAGRGRRQWSEADEGGLTASRLVATNVSGQLVSVGNLASWVAGTSNQLTVADDGDGTITLSLPSAVVMPGSLTVTGHSTPSADNTYDSGSTIARWRDVHVGRQVLGANGTAAAPSHSFANFTGHGSYAYGASHLGFSVGGTLQVLMRSDGAIIVPGTGFIGFAATAADTLLDTFLTRDAAGVLALKNSTTAQELRIYGTTTGPRSLRLWHDGSAGVIATNTTDSLYLGVNGAGYWLIGGTTGHLLLNTDNANDIGASGGNRPRTVYTGTSFRGPAGSVSAVTLGLGAANTGIFSPGSDYISFARAGTELVRFDASGLNIHSSFFIGFGSSGIGSPDVLLYRTSAGVLSLQNGDSVQEFRVWGTTTGSKYLKLAHNATNGYCETTFGDLYLYPSGGGNVVAVGNVLFNTDNANDLGASGATRPRTGYFGSAIAVGPAEAGLYSPQFGFYHATDPQLVVRETTNNVEFFINTTAASGVLIGAASNHLLAFRTNNATRLTISADGATLTFADALDMAFNTSTGTKFGTATTQKMGWWNATPVVQQVGGVTLTNNVTAGGTTNQLDDFTSLTVYATDAAAIRNNIYQLGRKLKLVTDALRTYGMLQNADS